MSMEVTSQIVAALFSIPFLLSLVGVAGQWVVQNGHRTTGWGVALLGQPLWAYYAISTRQYGFLLSCAVFGTLQARGVVKSLRESGSDENS